MTSATRLPVRPAIVAAACAFAFALAFAASLPAQRHLAAAATTTNATTTADWTTMRRDPSLNAVVAYAGAPHWTFAGGGTMSSSPVVVGDVVYLTDNAGDVDALDVATGEPRWHQRFSNAIMAAPIYANGIVYVGEGDEDAMTYAPRSHVQVGLMHNALIALDAKTGRVLWQRALRGTGMPTAAIVDGAIVHHDGFGDLLSLDATTGALRWRRNVHAASSMSAIVRLADGVLVSAGIFPNEVLAFDARDGRARWTTRFNENHSGIGDCPLASDGRLLFGTYLGALGKAVDPGVRAAHHVYALRAKDGSVAWDTALEDGDTPPRNEAAIPVVVRGIVYDGSAVAPYAHALDASTGRVIWTQKLEGPTKGAPVVVDGIVYLGDLHGYLWALDAKTGAIRGGLHTGVRFNVGSPVAVGGSLVIGSVEGTVVMMPLAEIRRGKDR